MAILMLRHTTPKVAPSTCYGRLDLDVAESFETEAESALARLPEVTRILTSPLQRCHKLATYVGAAIGCSVEIDPRLQEMDFGTWEGVLWNDIPREELDAWAADFYQARPHGGENVAALKARAEAVLRDLHPDDGNTLLVSHAGVVRAIFAEGEAAHHFQTEIKFGGVLPLPDQRIPS